MRLAFAILALAVMASPGGPVRAQGLGQDLAKVSILDGWRRDDGTRVAAVRIELEAGWHTYWRVPGATGIPPSFDWSESRNLASIAYEWPLPEVFESAGEETIGYFDVLVLPVILRPEDPTLPIDLSLGLFFGACDDICVPVDADVSARLEPDAPPRDRAPIEAALATRAWSPERAGVARATCTIAPGAVGNEIVATVTFDAAPGPDQTAIIESGRPEIWIGGNRSEARDRTVTATARIEPSGGFLDRGDLRVTVIDPRRFVEIRGCQSPG